MLHWYIPRSQHWILFLKLASWTCLYESIDYISLWFFGEIKHNNLVRSHQDITIPTIVTRCQLTCLSETCDPFLGDELTTTKSATKINLHEMTRQRCRHLWSVVCVSTFGWDWCVRLKLNSDINMNMSRIRQIDCQSSNAIIRCAYTSKTYPALPTCVTLQVTLTLRQQ